MSRKKAQELIEFLERNNFVLVLEDGAEISAKDAGLFYMDDFTPEAKGLYEDWKAWLKAARRSLREQKKQGLQISARQVAGVNFGLIAERIGPTFGSFPFQQKDCRPMFNPIDYLIFEGMSKKGKVDRIIFSEFKTGNAGLSNNQFAIKACVEKGRVQFKTY